MDGTDRCSGRLEVRSDQSWSSVCVNDFDQQDAEVVCKELGCGALSVLQGAPYAEDKPPVWSREFYCGGDESVLLDCISTSSAVKTCSTGEVVHLTCSGRRNCSFDAVNCFASFINYLSVSTQKQSLSDWWEATAVQGFWSCLTRESGDQWLTWKIFGTTTQLLQCVHSWIVVVLRLQGSQMTLQTDLYGGLDLPVSSQHLHCRIVSLWLKSLNIITALKWHAQVKINAILYTYWGELL